MKKLLLLILIGTIASQVFAQNQKADSSAKEPKTKLEAFEAQTGVVIIRGFSTTGTVKGKLGTRVTIECREFTEASSGKSEYGIAIGVAGEDSTCTSYVDYDEIDSLLKGIDYVAKIDKSVTKLDRFQADYRTKDDLVVSTFNIEPMNSAFDTDQNEIQASIQSGIIGTATAFLSIDNLTAFRGLIKQAKEKLDSIRNVTTKS